MEFIRAMINWVTANSALLWWLFASSVFLVVLSPIIVGWIIVRLPVDYFTKTDRRPLATWQHTPALRYVLVFVKNLVGLVLLFAGLIMLVAPGQGLLTMVIGLILLDFPGKYRLESWFIQRPAVWKSINWLRRRAKRPEIQPPPSM